VDDAAQALTFLSRAVSKRFLGQGGERERRQFRALVRARRGSALSPRPPAPG
jgi:hypothetical protein